jgi:hypothetical protein
MADKPSGFVAANVDKKKLFMALLLETEIQLAAAAIARKKRFNVLGSTAGDTCLNTMLGTL